MFKLKHLINSSLAAALVFGNLLFLPKIQAEENQDKIDVSISTWDLNRMIENVGEGPDLLKELLEEKFPRLNLIPVPVTWSDAKEKNKTWAASNQLPDVIGGVAMAGDPQMSQWIEGGLLRAIPEGTSEKYPNIAKFLDIPEVHAYDVDGQQYFLPRVNYPNADWWCMDRGLLVRKDWMEKLGIKDPKTEEDYIEMCRRFAQEDPDGNGIDDTLGYVPVQPWILLAQDWPGFGFSDGRILVSEDGQSVYNGKAGPVAFRVGSFLRKMFKAGGMDPDFASNKVDDSVSKFASGKAGIFGRQNTPVLMKPIYDKWQELMPKDKNFFDCVGFIHGPSVDGKFYRFREKPYWSESWFSSNVDDEKMDLILQLYDYLYSIDGQRSFVYGIKDKDYKVKEDGSIEMLTKFNEKLKRHEAAGDLYGYSILGNLAAWSAGALQYENPSTPKELIDMCTKERDERIQNWIGLDINWALQGVTTPEKEDAAAINFDDSWVRFISDTSDTPDEELYEKMKEEWKANGYDEAMQSIYDKAKEEGIIK